MSDRPANRKAPMLRLRTGPQPLPGSAVARLRAKRRGTSVVLEIMRELLLGAMIQQLDGLRDTHDLSEWETKFVADVFERTNEGAQTSCLSDKQAEEVAQVWRKHFA